MRRSQKMQIEDTLKLLDKAHCAVRKAIETGNKEIALTLLEQCQDSAIQMGSLIEETEGEGVATVRILEYYCEQIYQIYELIQHQQSINTSKMYKDLQREWRRIGDSVKNDIKVKTVAVFLPYKASMWDSLESVWQAADADPYCDTYVVPIPYFDKNPDGSFREMHYEGDEYPDYVPIVSWKEFDLALEHPDMIFIHNPYDEFNFITSVPPAYYSKELRKHTDELVYIPYFVLGEIEPDNKEDVENIEHFCMVPGVVNADKVIVQSDKMRQIYIDIMSKAMGEDTRKIWEKKVLGLGSPKIDKVLNIQSEKINIPDEWMRIIEKPDGSWKKIIFYNTSVSALLQYNERMLQKLEDVFSVFKENKDELALLWRPHPLMKATIESMRPRLWTEYDKLVTKYQEEGWGIYDDSADVDRAIVISDAYYGDYSSIVQMYWETGKPIMIQKVEVLDQDSIIDENKLEINFLAGVQVENDVYFSAWNMNGLFKYNPQTDQCVFLRYFPGEENLGVHSEAILYQNTIWFIPRASERIAIVDLESLNITYLELPECGYRLDRSNMLPIRMRGCHKEGEKFLWLIPREYRLFVKIDMDKRQIIEAQEWGNDELVRAMGIRVQNKLWVNVFSAGEIRVINVESGEQIIKKIQHEGASYIGIQNIDEKILLFPPYAKDGVLILDYDMGGNEIVYFDDHGQWYYEYQAMTENGDMLLVPYSGNQSVCVRVEKDCCFIKEVKDLGMEGNVYCSAKMTYEDQIWFLSHVTENPIICFEKRGDTFYHRHIVMNRGKYNADVAEAIIKCGGEYSLLNLEIIFDESFLPLNRFLLLIKGLKRKEESGEEKQIGKSIYMALQWQI